MLYDADDDRVGYATSFMYSPMLQRHIALARVRPDMAATGTRVDLEVTINHRYQRVGAVRRPAAAVQARPQDRLRISCQRHAATTPSSSGPATTA